jgi:hypothetical protein
VTEEGRLIDGVKQAKMWLRSTRRESPSVPVMLAVPPSGGDETAGLELCPTFRRPVPQCTASAIADNKYSLQVKEFGVAREISMTHGVAELRRSADEWLISWLIASQAVAGKLGHVVAPMLP